MDENQEQTIEEIDALINKNKTEMQELERTRNRCHYAKDEIALSKTVIRITENIRKLLRVRTSLLKESKNDNRKQQTDTTTDEKS